MDKRIKCDQYDDRVIIRLSNIYLVSTKIIHYKIYKCYNFY